MRNEESVRLKLFVACGLRSSLLVINFTGLTIVKTTVADNCEHLRTRASQGRVLGVFRPMFIFFSIKGFRAHFNDLPVSCMFLPFLTNEDEKTNDDRVIGSLLRHVAITHNLSLSLLRPMLVKARRCFVQHIVCLDKADHWGENASVWTRQSINRWRIITFENEKRRRRRRMNFNSRRPHLFERLECHRVIYLIRERDKQWRTTSLPSSWTIRDVCCRLTMSEDTSRTSDDNSAWSFVDFLLSTRSSTFE